MKKNPPALHPITEAMIIRNELHMILQKYGVTDELKRAECGLEILTWVSDRLIIDQRLSGQ